MQVRRSGEQLQRILGVVDGKALFGLHCCRHRCTALPTLRSRLMPRLRQHRLPPRPSRSTRRHARLALTPTGTPRHRAKVVLVLVRRVVVFILLIAGIGKPRPLDAVRILRGGPVELNFLAVGEHGLELGDGFAGVGALRGGAGALEGFFDLVEGFF